MLQNNADGKQLRKYIKQYWSLVHNYEKVAFFVFVFCTEGQTHDAVLARHTLVPLSFIFSPIPFLILEIFLRVLSTLCMRLEFSTTKSLKLTPTMY